MPRNPNGSGSIRQRADGRWEARYTAPDGRQRSIYAPDEPTARTRLQSVQAEMTLGLYFDASKITFETWARTWLSEYCNHIKPTTRDNYTAYMSNHLIPALGRIKLSCLRTMHIQRAFNAMHLSAGTQSSIKIC